MPWTRLTLLLRLGRFLIFFDRERKRLLIGDNRGNIRGIFDDRRSCADLRSWR